MSDDRAWTYDDEMAAWFVGVLDHFGPVAKAVVDRLPALPAEAEVVDLGCGLGEPSLSVLDRFPWVRVLGVDTSEEMLAIARTRGAETENARFAAMDVANLDLPAESVDAVVSRFAFLDQTSPESVEEFVRVARPGCAYSIAVWDRLELHTMGSALMESLRGLVDDVLLPPLDELDARTADEQAARALQWAGVAELECEQFTWTTSVDGFDTMWSTYGPASQKAALATLDTDRLAELRRRYTSRLEPYVQPDGSYLIPSTCRLFWGRL